MMNNEFGNRLKKYREELSEQRGEKVGQVKLAEELGVSRGAIGDLERGNREPSKLLLIKLVKHSGKSIDYWMDGVDNYEAPNTVNLVLDRLISLNVITSTNIDGKVWDVIKKAVELEIQRKLDKIK